MKYVLDFDGTIVNLWPRYFKVFCDANDISSIQFEEYKKYKRQYEKDEIVAKKLNIQLSDTYFEKKKVLLEKLDYLKLDTLLIDKSRLINFLNCEDSIILTKRVLPENYYNELNMLDLKEIKYRSFIISNKQLSKSDWLQNNFKEKPVTIIGDGKEEYKCRLCSNTDVILINTGLLDSEKYIHVNIRNFNSLDMYLQSIGY